MMNVLGIQCSIDKGGYRLRRFVSSVRCNSSIRLSVVREYDAVAIFEGCIKALQDEKRTTNR